jgi:flagellin-like protein
MLKRLLTQKRYFKNIYKKQKGITGLETAIILIAFVVVAAVFAYTVLSAGLFSTQKSQEAVYAGLEETQNTIDLKGAVVANGASMLNNCDYLGWDGTLTTGGTTIARETGAANKWEGSASMSAVVGDGALANETIAIHAMQAMDLTIGDTVAFWMKAPAGLADALSFAIGDSNAASAETNLSGSTLTYAINTNGGIGWQKYSFDVTDNATYDTYIYFGIWLRDGAATGTFYLDNVMIEDVAAQNGIPCGLDSCDFPTGWAATNTTVTRDTDNTAPNIDKVEGTAAMNCAVLDAAAANATVISHDMVAKDFVAGDTISFWVKVEEAGRQALTFAIGADASFSGDATEIQAIDQGAGDVNWHKYSMTLTSASADTGAVYYGVFLDTDAGAFTFWIDDIEISNASLNNNNDPMNSFGNSISFTVALASGGDGVDFTTTVDSDNDGMLSDESAKTHKVVVYYNDETQQLTDLAWTMNPIGKADGDSILDVGEKFEITVDLTYVNQNSGVWASSKIGKNKTFTLELKPPTGAVLTIQRTMPPKVLTVNNLN